MLNRFRHHKHDFKMYLSKIWFIETHYNIATFIVYLENIIFQQSAHWKYQEKKFALRLTLSVDHRMELVLPKCHP